MIYLLLFAEFFKVGLFAIGGGLAAIPFLKELSEKYAWFSQADLTEMIAVSESTPGPIGINIATYAGYMTAGVLGGVISTIGFVLPSFIIVSLLSRLLLKYRSSPLVEGIFKGLRPAVSALIASAFLAMLSSVFLGGAVFADGFPALWSAICMVDWRAVVILAVTIFGVVTFKLHPIWYIAGGAIVGILLKL